MLSSERVERFLIIPIHLVCHSIARRRRRPRYWRSFGFTPRPRTTHRCVALPKNYSGNGGQNHPQIYTDLRRFSDSESAIICENLRINQKRADREFFPTFNPAKRILGLRMTRGGVALTFHARSPSEFYSIRNDTQTSRRCAPHPRLASAEPFPALSMNFPMTDRISRL